MAAFGGGFGTAAATTVNHNPNKDVELASPPDDSISSLSFSPTANHLVATSWDNKVRPCQQNVLLGRFQHHQRGM
jgi:mRNA export factor